MSERTVLVVVREGDDATYAATEALADLLGAPADVHAVAVVRCDDATAEALLDSLEDEVTT